MCLRARVHDRTCFTALGGVGTPGAAVWRRLASLDFSMGQSHFGRGAAKFIENIEVLEVVPKWAPLKTSLDVFRAVQLLELAKAGVLI